MMKVSKDTFTMNSRARWCSIKSWLPRLVHEFEDQLIGLVVGGFHPFQLMIVERKKSHLGRTHDAGKYEQDEYPYDLVKKGELERVENFAPRNDKYEVQ
jgi:hypothetical protein